MSFAIVCGFMRCLLLQVDVRLSCREAAPEARVREGFRGVPSSVRTFRKRVENLVRDITVREHRAFWMTGGVGEAVDTSAGDGSVHFETARAFQTRDVARTFEK